MAHFIVGGIDSIVAQQEAFIPKRPIATAGSGTHFTLGGDGETEAVTNEDYVGALSGLKMVSEAHWKHAGLLTVPNARWRLR